MNQAPFIVTPEYHYVTENEVRVGKSGWKVRVLVPGPHVTEVFKGRKVVDQITMVDGPTLPDRPEPEPAGYYEDLGDEFFSTEEEAKARVAELLAQPLEPAAA